MRIDAHQHFWLLADRGGAWPPQELGAIYRDYQPRDLQPLLDRHHIDATILVQSLEDDAESEALLALAERHDFIGAVVGWTDLKAADAPTRIERLAAHPKFKGLRPMLQSLPDDWLDDPALAPAVAAMMDYGLSMDALVLPRQLPALLRFARRYPQLPIVIDHAAKPPIASGAMDAWRHALAPFADLPQVSCKLSGLLTEAPPHCTHVILQPWVGRVLAVFTPARLLWGSDWPVLNLAGDYAAWIEISGQLLGHLGAEEQAAIMGGNAARFYRLA